MGLIGNILSAVNNCEYFFKIRNYTYACGFYGVIFL